MERFIPRLEQRLELRLKLLPQFWQLINLVQIPITQLKEKLEEESEENPLLELEEEEQADIPEESDFEIEEENAWWEQRVPQTSVDEEKKAYLESLITKPESLQEHLLKQLFLQKLSKKNLEIAEQIIGNIDEDGYFKGDISEIAKKYKASKKTVEKVLKLIQTFDPLGVGARDLKECLTVQLKAKGFTNKEFEEIISHYLTELATHDYEKIEKELNISEDKLQKFIKILKTLDPKPGRNYTNSFPSYAIPELLLEIDDEGNFHLYLNEREIPKIRINKNYLKLLKDPNTPKDAKKFLRGKLKSARELISALEQRNKTILKIANFLINYQKEFFLNGKSALRPLTLRKVAEETGLDESTISRAVNGKFMETPQGIIELRELFSGQIKGISSEYIKEKIKEIIAEENPSKPLSDGKIAEILKQEGIEIARRTVAKYREEMKILPAKLRRR